MGRLGGIVVVVMWAALAHADEQTESARLHFQIGQRLYDEHRYQEAIAEFEAARRARPLPAFDFNIARCHEQLRQFDAAADDYRRYLASQPEDADTVRARIAELEERHRAALELRASAPPRRRWWAVPAGVGAGALALGVVGAGLLGSGAADFRHLQTSCSPLCAPSQVAGLPAREHAGEAMLGLAAAAVAVDVVLWIVEARRARERR